MFISNITEMISEGVSMRFSKSEYLHDVLDSYKMGHVEELMDKYKKKRDEIKEEIEKEYTDKLAQNPINSGSYAKHTAINIKFDIDLFIPFKKGSFASLEEMYEDIYDFFTNSDRFFDPQLSQCKRQRTSIGMKFYIEDEEIDMDVVPGREIEIDEYVKTGNVNLFDSKGDQRSIKTNVKKHIELISGKNVERSIIRLLKVWKYRNGIDIRSFLIELFVLKAFGNIKTGNLWDKLEAVFCFIKDNIKTIKLVDPANTNNVVTDTLTENEKNTIENTTKNMLDRIEDSEETICSYFPENTNFKKAEKVYIEKEKKPSVLKTRSFG